MPSLDHLPCGLALHTCSHELGLAKLNATGQIISQTYSVGLDLANQLQLILQDFLLQDVLPAIAQDAAQATSQGMSGKALPVVEPPLAEVWRSLQFLAVATGPGGFTSTRVGLVTAQTLASQLSLPLWGFSTLAIAAWDHYWAGDRAMAPDLGPEESCLVWLPARRGEVHLGQYDCQDNSLQEAAIAPLVSEAERDRLIAERGLAVVALESGELGHQVRSLLDLARRAQANTLQTNCARAVAQASRGPIATYGQSPVAAMPQNSLPAAAQGC